MNTLGDRRTVKTVQIRADSVRVGDVFVSPATGRTGEKEYEVTEVLIYDNGNVGFRLRDENGPLQITSTHASFATVTIRVLTFLGEQ